MNMGNIHLVTGYAGQEHVTAADQGAFNSALLGNRQLVLGKGNRLAASVVTVNQIRVLDGDIYMQGRYIRLNEGNYVDLAIANGTQGYNRNDLIVARYTRNEVSGVEDVSLVVIKGTNATGTPADPAYTVGNILDDHAILNDMPLYRVPVNGLNVGTLVPLFTVLDDTLLSVCENKQDNIDRLTTETGIADADFLPFYDSSVYGHRKTTWANIKTVLGRVFAAKSHSHTTADIGAAKEVHAHKASDITSGVLPTARGGTGVASLAALESALGYARTELITYTGTGAAGADNPTTITCSVVPKVLVYVGYMATQGGRFYRPLHTVDAEALRDMLPVAIMPTEYTSGFGLGVDDTNHTLHGKRSADGKTVSWYDAGDYDTEPDPSAQCNYAGRIYYFLAIG